VTHDKFNHKTEAFNMKKSYKQYMVWTNSEWNTSSGM